MAIGAIGSAVAFANDIAVDRGFLAEPRIAGFSFAFLVASLAVFLANRFVRTHSELEDSRPWLIAVTANAISGDREKYLASGMDDYVSKPLRVADLRHALERGQRALSDDSAHESFSPPARPESEDLDELVLDQGVLTDLLDLDQGAGDLLKETIDVFVSSTPQRLEDLAAALARGDFDGLGRLAHTMKSSSGIVGGRRMMSLCARLESLSRDDPTTAGPELIQHIGEQFAFLRAQLEDFAGG